MRFRSLVLATSALAAACAAAPSPGLTDAERDAIAADVRATVDAFADAERRQDVEALVDHLAPEFYMYGDGVRADYDTAVSQIRSSLPALQRFDTTWSGIEVTVLGRDHALVSMIFHDAITDAGGDTTRMWGPNTFVWRRVAGGWKLIYVDADHYPETAGG
jgi:ketosteroid isomerase-like protein